MAAEQGEQTGEKPRGGGGPEADAAGAGARKAGGGGSDASALLGGGAARCDLTGVYAGQSARGDPNRGRRILAEMPEEAVAGRFAAKKTPSSCPVRSRWGNLP